MKKGASHCPLLSSNVLSVATYLDPKCTSVESIKYAQNQYAQYIIADFFFAHLLEFRLGTLGVCVCPKSPHPRLSWLALYGFRSSTVYRMLIVCYVGGLREQDRGREKRTRGWHGMEGGRPNPFTKLLPPSLPPWSFHQSLHLRQAAKEASLFSFSNRRVPSPCPPVTKVVGKWAEEMFVTNQT